MYLGKNMEEKIIKVLINKALEARKKAYTPYSHFNVGAAILGTNDKIYTGCNIENAAYTPSNCAERTAIFKAVSEGVTSFKAIAVVGGKKESKKLDIVSPCGVCRQVMMEFCSPKTFEIILAADEENYKIFKLDEILPMGFGAKDLESEEAYGK
jgi:cytidine deaminase